MYVSGFWLGVLITLVVEIMLVIILGILRAIRGDDYEDEEEMSDEEISEMLTDMTDNNYKFKVKNGILTVAKRKGEDDAENN